MSLIGFDIGNNSCATAVTKPRTIQILQDDEANYETPSLISFAEKKRHFGSYAASLSIANPSSTLSQIKRLVGKEHGAICSELKELPFATSKADDGGIMIEVDHCGSTWKFTVVQILAMLMSHLKKGAQKYLGGPVTDCVIGIPSYFSDRERFAYLDAAEIAGLKPLKLMHEGTAIALGYGIYNQNYQGNVVFVDVGHCATQVTLVSFKEGEMYVLSHASDENLGGRDFDRILYDHFSIYFITRFGIEVRFANKRARARLLSECEKLKKVLSANKEARMSIECLVDGTDVDGSITRDEFTTLSQNLLGRLRQTCERAVAGNKELLVGTVELVGSASRIPAISDVLIGYFGNIISRTLNASECVARGCALQCSMLSPNSRFSKYIIKDSIPFNIEVLNNKIMNPLFVKGEHFPSDKSINLCIGKDEFIDLGSSRQQDTSCTPFQLIRRFKVIGDFKRGNPNSRGQVMFRFDYHGCITVQSARVIEKDYLGRWQGLNILQVVESSPFKMLDPAIDDEKAVLSDFTENDNSIEETHNQKNLLETHLNETRKKLTGQFKNFASDLEKDYISQWLKDTKTWLYKDGEDVSKDVYMDKLSELKQLLDPIESCFRRSHATNQAKGELVKNITSRRNDVACLPLATKNAVMAICDKINEYLDALEKFTEKCPININHEFVLSVIDALTNSLNVCCENIRTDGFSSPTRELSWNGEPFDLEVCHSSYASSNEENGNASESFVGNIIKTIMECLQNCTTKERDEGKTAKLQLHSGKQSQNTSDASGSGAVRWKRNTILELKRVLKRRETKELRSEEVHNEQQMLYNDRKKKLKEVILDTQNELFEGYGSYMTDSEKKDISSKLDYIKKLSYYGNSQEEKFCAEQIGELERLLYQIEDRYIFELRNANVARAHAIGNLLYCIFQNRVKGIYYEACKDKINSECENAEDWLAEETNHQTSLTKSDNPLEKDINTKAYHLNSSCQLILEECQRSLRAQATEKRNELKRNFLSFDEEYYVTYKNFCTELENTEVTSLIQNIKKLLSEGGADVSAVFYTKAMEELNMHSDAIQKRISDKNNHEEAVRQLRRQIYRYLNDPKLSTKAKNEIERECKNAEKWADDSVKYSSREIYVKKADLFKTCEHFKKCYP